MTPEVRVVDLAEALSRFDDHWNPRVAAELNGHEVKLAKLLGGFEWHAHDDTDELFLVLEGRLVIELRDGEVTLETGQMTVIPAGVEHRPVADEEVHLLLFEPTGTLNTGNVRSERTVDLPERL